MGRPPCCDKIGIKKGPWTPEEDIILVSYIQEHGPGNWRSVPTNTGLLRCSKSCRLRWTNYLRPGIKRGNFTPHEEGMIIHLQALLGNKWAAIASYLPQRTDNDIKNYWNTHLKKKLKKLQSTGSENNAQMGSENSPTSAASYHHHHLVSNNTFSDRPQIATSSSLYASSAENISRLLEGWMRASSSSSSSKGLTATSHGGSREEEEEEDDQNRPVAAAGGGIGGSNDNNGVIPKEEYLDSILTFGSLMNGMESESCSGNKEKVQEGDNNPPPLSFLEKWLLDESAAQVEEDEGEDQAAVMELPTIFS